jgi:hypothetical protein
VGCTGCHYDIKADAHPVAPKEIASARAFALESVQTCRNCHDDKFKEWDNSIHASLVRDGNAVAPLCCGCCSNNDPHRLRRDPAKSLI